MEMAGTIAEKWVERAIADIVGWLEFGAAIVCSLQRASHAPDAATIRNLLQASKTMSPEAFRRLESRFRDWYAWTLDLPGSYYLQVVEHLFKDNRLATGRFVALGRTIDLSTVRCPLFLLAARDDDVVGREQMFAIEHLVDGKLCTVEKTVAPCGHLGLFM